MFTHLHENNKQKLNFINSFELLKKGIFIFHKLFFLVFTAFAFSIAQAQTVAKQHHFEKDMQELLTESPETQTEFAGQHNLGKDAVKEVGESEELKTEFFPEMTVVQTEKEEPQIPVGMVKIPEGEFLMGSYSGEEDELPDHLVYIKSFLLDAHEVTNEAYSRCHECERGSGGFDTFDRQQPVVYVDWENAEYYCNSQNKRLPTEAEWGIRCKSR